MTGQLSGAGARIAHLSTVHQSWDNRILNKECRALAEAGFDVHLVISADADRVTHGVQVHALTPRGRAARLLGSQAEAWRALDRIAPHLLHFHDPELIPLALAYGRRHKIPVVYDAHEDLVKQIDTKPYLQGRKGDAARRAARRLIRMADRHCDAIVTVIDEIAQTFSPVRDGRERPVAVVRNLPWKSDFTVVDPAATDPVAVYTGDISQERGLTRMLDAVHHVEGARLVLAGRNLVGDALPVGDPQVDYCGLVPPAELPGIIAQGRVGLVLLSRLPNYEHSLPTKVFEYMASGLPFLASDFGYWRELFGGIDAGVFVDPDDPTAVGSALAELLADPARCAELGANGRRAVAERFSFEAEATTLVGLVNRLLAA
ncbi:MULTISPECIES: glycosyltransferase family 4 protein [unclassified Luteococcus]|uniref:glycosyltransferase family 4 protein n=1 Tax=unclassified Luteococcus TaxID=2639923 RepID=UPI00313DF57A